MTQMMPHISKHFLANIEISRVTITKMYKITRQINHMAQNYRLKSQMELYILMAKQNVAYF